MQQSSYSFVGLFLPAGANAILIDFFDPVSGRGGEIESFYWNSMPWIHDIHYPVQLSDIVLGSLPSGCGSIHNVSMCSRDEFYLYNDVRTSSTVMTSLVYSALIRVEETFGFHNTFDRVHAAKFTR